MKYVQFSITYWAVCGVISSPTRAYSTVWTELIFIEVKLKSSSNIKIPNELDLPECK